MFFADSWGAFVSRVVAWCTNRNDGACYRKVCRIIKDGTEELTAEVLEAYQIR